MKTSKYAKVGEKIQIVTPKLFIRCGYPLYPDKILRERKWEVNALMHAAWHAMNKHTLGKTVPELHLVDFPWWIEKRLQNMALTVILHREGFGGKERKIYEEEIPQIQDKIFEVTGRRFVVTGTYTPGWSSQDYWSGEWDGELPSLENQQRHCVYAIDCKYHWIPMKNYVKKHEILAEHCSTNLLDLNLVEDVVRKIDRSI